MGIGRILEIGLTSRRNRSPKLNIVEISRAAASAAKE